MYGIQVFGFLFPFLPFVSLMAPFCVPLVYFLVAFGFFFLSIYCFIPIKKKKKNKQNGYLFFDKQSEQYIKKKKGPSPRDRKVKCNKKAYLPTEKDAIEYTKIV